IWNQYDFDYEYALDVFIFQLNKIADFLDSDRAYTVSAKANASSIRRLIRLMKDVKDEKFLMEYHDRFKEKYGEVKIKYTPNGKYFTIEDEFPVIEGKTEEELNKIYVDMMKESITKQEKAHKLVWKLLERHIRGWWD
ncbi:MAG: hypothetical protein H5T96_09735, partial [Tissierellales bacterium]|nr:hypothetical protein [Tissierellales bacterium]